MLGRLGGDEFAVLLPEAGPGELRAAAERFDQRLRLVIAALARPRVPARPTARPPRSCTACADADLYRAKQRRAVAARLTLAYAPSARAITICWTSSVPSPMVRIFASRYKRHTGYSSM